MVFEYQPSNEDELELKVGDVVEIIEEVISHFTLMSSFIALNL